MEPISSSLWRPLKFLGIPVFRDGRNYSSPTLICQEFLRGVLCEVGFVRLAMPRSRFGEAARAETAVTRSVTSARVNSALLLHFRLGA